MFHKAIELKFKKGTTLEVTFQTGEVKEFDMKTMFEKHPQLSKLTNRKLFVTGKLLGTSGIIWNEELDIDAETIYEEGILVRQKHIVPNLSAANAVRSARASAGISQQELSAITGITQADISKIEKGLYNPSVTTLDRIAKALQKELIITIK